MLVDIIFAPRLARGDEDRRGGGVARGNEPHFARHMIAGRDDDPAPRLGFGHPAAIALIGLAIEFDLLDRLATKPVPPRSVGWPLPVGEPKNAKAPGGARV